MGPSLSKKLAQLRQTQLAPIAPCVKPAENTKPHLVARHRTVSARLARPAMVKQTSNLRNAQKPRTRCWNLSVHRCYQLAEKRGPHVRPCICCQPQGETCCQQEERKGSPWCL